MGIRPPHAARGRQPRAVRDDVSGRDRVHSGPWTAGGPPTVRGIDMDQRPLLGVGGQLGGLHPGGFNALFVDGSVRFLNEIIDPAVLSSMMTIHVKE